jgi:hypothetical protein
MGKNGAITFGDPAGKLEVVRVACERCSRAGRYRLRRLIARYGREGTIADFMYGVSAGCPQREAAHIPQRCRVTCRDLLKVALGHTPADDEERRPMGTNRHGG